MAFTTGAHTMRPVKAVNTSQISRGSLVCKAHHKVNQVAAAGLLAATLVAGSASALTYDEVQGLTYLQVKGTGQANRCPELTTGSGPKALKAGTYSFEKMCLEPASFQVKEEGLKGVPEYVKTKLMTRLTYTLDEISGTLKVGNDGSVELKESDGIDYAAVTVQLPGGERVPFLFTVKQMELSGNVESFKGQFTVPSYRGSSFLDPKGRGASTGYDNAVALPAKSDDEELLKENIKSTKALVGQASFSISKFDPQTGELGGNFETVQPSDTDLGAKAPKDVKISGAWYARLASP